MFVEIGDRDYEPKCQNLGRRGTRHLLHLIFGGGVEVLPGTAHCGTFLDLKISKCLLGESGLIFENRQCRDSHFRDVCGQTQISKF